MKKTKIDLSEKYAKYARHEINGLTRAILKIWQANREFRMRDTQFEDYEKLSAEYDGLLKTIDARNRELTKLRKERDKLTARLVLLNTRARSGMRGYFGLKSPEFAQIKTRNSPTVARQPQEPVAVKTELPPEPAGRSDS
ncbi:MAG TPA: hypothetical protein VFC17_05240 [Candidatus Limnocylindrales bacterium]|nr:hypothetical protein [Candidatus Limnocylindrales bacterium]